MDMPPELGTFGRRIMIMGPSNSGKSTLAVALGARIGVPVVHMDQLRHLPNTNWQIRPDAEFAALHDAAILADEWVIEGNYSALMPQRFARATGVVVISDGLVKRYGRYFARTLFQKRRAGGLEGEQDSVNWMMLNWLRKTRNSVGKYRQAAAETGLPHLFVGDQRRLDRLYAGWGLTLPAWA